MKKKILQDVINSGKGWILTICDRDIIALLKLRDEEKYEGISDYMRDLFNIVIL